jgi:DNA-binding PucR family transcriptional regulator
VALVIADDDSLSRDLARHAIAPLVDYDAEHGTELVTTAAAVLDASQRITIAASVLHVHENTVRQRITRIDHLLGPGWREGGSSLDVHLALRLHQLTRSRRHTI